MTIFGPLYEILIKSKSWLAGYENWLFEKYLNQTVFFTKFAKNKIYILAEGFHP